MGSPCRSDEAIRCGNYLARAVRQFSVRVGSRFAARRQTVRRPARQRADCAPTPIARGNARAGSTSGYFFGQCESGVNPFILHTRHVVAPPAHHTHSFSLFSFIVSVGVGLGLCVACIVHEEIGKLIDWATGIVFGVAYVGGVLKLSLRSRSAVLSHMDVHSSSLLGASAPSVRESSSPRDSTRTSFGA